MEALTQVIIFSNWLILAGMFMLMNIAYSDSHVLPMEKLVLGTVSAFFAQGFVIWSWLPLVAQDVFLKLGLPPGVSQILLTFSQDELVYSNAIVFFTIAGTWGVIHPCHQEKLEKNIIKIVCFVLPLSLILGLPAWGVPVCAILSWFSTLTYGSMQRFRSPLGILDLTPLLFLGAIGSGAVFLNIQPLSFLLFSQTLLTVVLVTSMSIYFFYVEFRYRTSYRFQLQLVEQVDGLIESKKRADEMAKSKDDFLSIMSHEIRTPLNGVLASAHMMAQTEMKAEQASYVNMIQVSGDNLMRLIDDILDLPALEAGRVVFDPKPSQLRQCIEHVAEVVSVRFLDKPVDLVTHVANDLPQVLIYDSQRLTQVLINLANNAIKFTAEGFVKIIATLENQGENYATICIKVVDSGIGISQENQMKIFQAYGQASASISRQYGGTGLGLTICKKIIDAMNGQMWVESELGKGSTFAIRVRLTKPKEQPQHTISVQYPFDVFSLIDSPFLGEQLGELVKPLVNDYKPLVKWDETVALELSKDVPFIFIVSEKLYTDEIKNFIENLLQSKIYPVYLTKKTIGKGKLSYIFKSYLRTPLKEHAILGLLEDAKNDANSTQIRSRSPRVRVEQKPLLALKHPMSILVAEDNPINQKLIHSILVRWGYAPILVSNGLEALIAVQRQTFDIILMDVQMNEMDGLESTREIITRFPHAMSRPKIIALTANAMPGDKERCLMAGMDDYLTKPIKIPVLEEKIVYWSTWWRRSRGESA